MKKIKAKIIRPDVSRIENGVRKGMGDVVEITKDELKSGGYAPLRVNVKPRTAKSNVSDGDTEEADKSE